MTFSIDQLQFLDSFQFTMQSLDSLVNTMDNEYLKHTHAAFPLEDQFYLMKKKGYPRMISSIISPNSLQIYQWCSHHV